MFKAVAAWNRRRQSIRALSALSDRELADIGVVRGQIETLVRQMPALRHQEAEPAVKARTARPDAATAAAFARQGLPTRA